MTSIFSFGPYEVDEARREVRRRRKPLPLHATPLRLLLYLLHHRDRTVPKRELLDRVWPGVAVSDTVLSAALKEVRRALGDDGREQRVIRTLRGRGYQVVAPVVERTGGSTRLDAAPDFVGREEVLGQLTDALEVARAGRGRVVLLSGAAGIGKTRTAEELAREARARGVPVHTTWCEEGGGAPAYWPFVRLLRELAEASGAALPAILARVVSDALPDASVTGELGRDLGEARFRLFDAAAAFLRRAAAERGLVAIVDDLQWADASSLGLLEFLSREVARARLLLVVTCREADVDCEDALARCLGTLARSDAYSHVRLGGLGRSDVRTLLEAVTGTKPPGALVSRVFERTDGNPFFVRALASSGRDAGAVPESVRDLIRGRLQRLSPPARVPLAFASALGNEFGTDLVARATGMAAEPLAAALEEARRAELLRPASGAAHRFAHALVREAVYAEQPAPERLRIHRCIAETLEALSGEHPGDELGELARHFGAAGDVEKAARYAERAGERAMALLAFEAAAAHFEHALRLLEERAAPDASRRCDLLLAIGRARLAEGDRGRSRDAFRRAAAPASELGDGNRLVQSAIGFVTNTTTNTQDPEGAALLERALVALGPEDSSTRIRAMIRLAVVRLGLGAPEQAEALVREAAARAERLRDPRALGWVALNGVWLLAFLGKESPETLVASLDRAIALGRDVGQPELVNGAQELLMQPLLTLGDRRRADAVAASLAERAPLGGIRASMSVLYRCHAALQAGRLAEAERLVAEALAGPAKDYAPAWAESHLYLLRAEQGRLGEIERILEQRAASRPQIVELSAVRAHLLAELGRHGEARVELERASRDGFRDLPNVPLQNLGPVLLADACAALGAEEHAAPLYERLRPCAPYNAMAGAFGAFWGPVARPLGVLATLLARFDEAERHFADAEAFCRRMDAVLWELHTAHDRARMLMARGARGDRERALGLVAEGLVPARRLGLVALERRLAALEAELAGAIPIRGPERTRVSR